MVLHRPIETTRVIRWDEKAGLLRCWPAVGDLGNLFSSDEADAQGGGESLASREGAEVGGVDVVDDGIGILAVEDVHGFHARGPKVAAESEFLFNPKI